MAITVNDLRFYKSERMTDFQDGGGQMTGNEIVSGVENQIFLDVSDVDRAAGDVSIRKIYAAVTSADTDPYLDAGVVVFDEPDDPNTSVLITSTGDFFDERAAIQTYIENYRIQSSRYSAWLFELQIEGARTITLFTRIDDDAPSINTTLLLIEYTASNRKTVSHQQYVRVIRILLDEVQTFNVGNGDFQRRVVICELSEALRYTFHGAEISLYDNLHPLAVIYNTMVVDAAKYYGIRPLVQQADPGDTVIYADSIRGRLIPSSQTESPVTDVTAVGERTFAVPASLTTISFTVSDTFIPGFVLYAGRPIVPGTLVISISGGTLVDDGGNLKSGQTSVGEVDYAQGVITFSILSPTYAGTKTVTFRPGAAISRASNCYAIPITDQTRFRAYVASIKPKPDPGTLIVDYLSSGNWYRLRDNGNGALTGASAAYGSGTINFTTGSVSLSLGSYPDINSAILFSWGSGADTRSLTQAAQALTFKVSTGRGGLVPGEQTLAWSGNTLTDQGDGTMTGTGGSAVIDYASGELTLTPTTIPAANTALTFAGKQYAPASWYDESFTPSATDGVISCTLAHQDVIPVSMTVYYTVQVADAVSPPTYPITSISTTATTATLTIGTHTFDVGSVIIVESLESPLQYLNGTYTVTGKTDTTVTFAASNEGYPDTDTFAVSNVATTATTTTLTIGTHTLNVGNPITVSNITAPLAYLNGTQTVTGKTDTTVTFAATNAGYTEGTQSTEYITYVSGSLMQHSLTFSVEEHDFFPGDQVIVAGFSAPYEFLNKTFLIETVTHDALYDDSFTVSAEDTSSFDYVPPANTATAQNIQHTNYYSGDYDGDVDYSFTAYYSGDYGGTFSYPINVMPLSTRVIAAGQGDNGWIRRERDNIDLSFTAGGAINPSAGTFTLETDCAFAWHSVPVYEYVAQQIQVWDEATNAWVIQVIVVQVLVRYDLVADVIGSFKPGSTVYVNYAVNNTPVAFSDGLTLATGGLRFSLQPVTGEQIASGSVRLLLGDRVYQDVGSQMVYGFNPATGAGTVAGSIDTASGQVILTDWASAANSYTIEARAIRIPSVPITTVTFRTPTAPIAVGSFSFRVNRYQSDEVFEGRAGPYGDISGNGVTGKFDYQTGVAMLTFGTHVVTANHQTTDWFVWSTQHQVNLGETTIAPNLVDLATLRYNCVTYISMPLDANVIGIDPVRLPGDGLVPIYRTGQIVLVHHTATHSENSLSPTQTVDMTRERLYRVVIDDDDGKRFPASFYSLDRETGIVTMASDLNLTGYTAPYVFRHTVADLSVIMDTDLSGRLALTRPVSHTFPSKTSRVSALLYVGTLQARYTHLFAQETWTEVWSDERIGDSPLAQYNDVSYPIAVSNLGAYSDRVLFRFTSNSVFACYGEQLGYIGSGSINEDFTPINPLTTAAYFHLDYRGWGAGWSTGNCLRFNLMGANYPVDCIRAIQPSPATDTDDSVELLFIGNVDA